MAEFRRTFELLAAPLMGIPEEVMESTFINKLKAHIRAEVRLLQPKGLGQLIEVAQRVEDKNWAMKVANDSLGTKGNKPLGFKGHLSNSVHNSWGEAFNSTQRISWEKNVRH